MDIPLDVLNYYGPYKNREKFWELVQRSGFLSSPNLILGGDLNLTLKSSETWGIELLLILSSHTFTTFFILWGLWILLLLMLVPCGGMVG